MRKALSKQELAGLKFEPKLNANSVRLVQGTQRNFTDRTMGQYLSKHKRQDKDPRQIEYERQQKECTFKPKTITAQPASSRVGRQGDSRSPVAQSRPGPGKKSFSPEKVA